MIRYNALDIHKNYISGYLWQPGQQKGRHFRFPNTAESLSEYAQTLGPDDRVVFEMTGNAFEVYDVLSKHAGQVVVANPVELKRLGSGRHTDRIDTERLAKMLALDIVPTVWVPPQPIRELRVLLAYYRQLQSARNRANNQAKAALRRQGYALKRNEDVRRWLAKHGVPGKLPWAEQVILASALQVLAGFDQQLQALESEIVRLIQPIPAVRLLLSAPGVGWLTAAQVYARIGEPERFRSPKQVGRFTGLDPSVFQSGDQDYRGRVTRNGSTELRRVLVEAAFSLVRHGQGPFVQFYRRLEKRIGRKRAIIALARKLMILLWRMLQSGETYRWMDHETYERKLMALDRAAETISPYPVHDVLSTVLSGNITRKAVVPRVRTRVRTRTRVPA